MGTKIGQMLKRAIGTRSFREFARSLGGEGRERISHETIRGWIRGQYLPSKAVFPRLAPALRLTVSELEQLVEADRAARGQGDENGSQASGAAHAGHGSAVDA